MFIRRMMQMAMVMLLAVTLGQVANAQRGGGGRWIYLGEANVDGSVDHDRITVGRDDGRFRALRIRVERARIEFQRVIVHYANGERDELPIRDRIRAGGQTRVIDLPGRDRAINSVEFWYARANGRSQRPKLLLYGR